MPQNPLSQADGYKLSHYGFMREGTTKLYANITARSHRLATFQDSNLRVVFAGAQAFVKDYLIREWQEGFFKRPLNQVIGEWQARVEGYLGKGAVSMAHFKALHKLGYLPKLVGVP